MTDWALMAGIGTVLVLLTSLFWIWYNGEMLYEINREHAERIEGLNHDLIKQREMLRVTEMQARVMGAMPVGRLIGDTDEVGEEPA